MRTNWMHGETPWGPIEIISPILTGVHNSKAKVNIISILRFAQNTNIVNLLLLQN